MAVIGISRSETFEYLLDSDPCKKRVELEVPRSEDGRKTAHGEVKRKLGGERSARAVAE